MVGILVGGGGIKLFKMWRKREEGRATTTLMDPTSSPSAPPTDMNELEEDFHHQLTLEEQQQQHPRQMISHINRTGTALLTPQMLEMQQQREK